MSMHWSKWGFLLWSSCIWLTISPGAAVAASSFPLRHRVVPKPVPRVRTEPSIAAGAALYVRGCLSCHGPRGNGEGFWSLPTGGQAPRLDQLDGAAWTPSAVSAVIRQGGGLMPSWGKVLTPGQIQSLAMYVESLNQRVAPVPKTETPEPKSTSELWHRSH